MQVGLSLLPLMVRSVPRNVLIKRLMDFFNVLIINKKEDFFNSINKMSSKFLPDLISDFLPDKRYIKKNWVNFKHRNIIHLSTIDKLFLEHIKTLNKNIDNYIKKNITVFKSKMKSIKNNIKRMNKELK